MEKHFFKKQILGSLIVVAIGLLGLWVIIKTTSIKISSQPEIVELEISKEEIERIKKGEEEIKEKELTHFEKFQDYKKVNIYKDFVTPIEINQFCTPEDRDDKKCKTAIARLTVRLQTIGDIKDAYLYIKAGVSREGMLIIGQLTPYDTIYLYLDQSRNGGHLIRPKALMYRVSEDGLTELLYKLDNIPFTHLPYKETAEPDTSRNSDLLSVLNQEGVHYLGSFTSTLGYGKIFELVIGYKDGEIQVIK